MMKISRITLRYDILETCLERFEGNLRNGDHANVKLNIDNISKNFGLKLRLIQELGGLAMPFKPTFFSAVPDGMNSLTKEVADQFGLPFAQFRKNRHDSTRLEFANHRSRLILLRTNGRGVLFEDVARELGSIQKVLDMPEAKDKFSAVVSIWDRGVKLKRHELTIPHLSIVHEDIPAIIPEDSPFWQHVRDNIEPME